MEELRVVGDALDCVHEVAERDGVDRGTVEARGVHRLPNEVGEEECARDVPVVCIGRHSEADEPERLEKCSECGECLGLERALADNYAQTRERLAMLCVAVRAEHGVGRYVVRYAERVQQCGGVDFYGRDIADDSVCAKVGKRSTQRVFVCMYRNCRDKYVCSADVLERKKGLQVRLSSRRIHTHRYLRRILGKKCVQECAKLAITNNADGGGCACDRHNGEV